MQIYFHNSTEFSMPKRFLTGWLEAVEKKLKKRKVIPKRHAGFESIGLAFVTNGQMRRLNRNFRKKNYATDVLSFEGHGPMLGELVISPQVVKKQAKEHGLTYKEELGYMILHGFLHLLGFDHEKSAAAERKMFNLQDAVFEELLLTRTFTKR